MGWSCGSPTIEVSVARAPRSWSDLRAARYAAAKRVSSARSPNRSRLAMNASGPRAGVARCPSGAPRAGRRPRSARPCSSTPSAYRAQLATIAAERRISPPLASCWRTTGSSHFGMRSELSAQRRGDRVANLGVREAFDQRPLVRRRGRRRGPAPASAWPPRPCSRPAARGRAGSCAASWTSRYPHRWPK